MSNQKKETKLSWDEFQLLGEANGPPENEIEPRLNDTFSGTVRIFIEKKKRGGKKASVIKGIVGESEAIKLLCNKIKKQCGVGGSYKDDEIVIQGDNREKIKAILVEEGLKDVKLAGG